MTLPRRIAVIALLSGCLPVLAAEAPTLLIRVERRAVDDLTTLRAAGIPVVRETAAGLLVEGDAAHAAWLRARGFSTAVLDDAAQSADYLQVGLRPDSDLVALRAAGTVIHEEENWVLLRVPRGTLWTGLEDAHVLVSRVPHRAVDLPVPGLPAAPLSGPNPLIQKMVDSVKAADISKYWSDLTVNPPNGTRYSYAQGCRDAATYCHDQLELLKVPAEYQDYNTSYAPNVIGTQPGAITPGQVYIVIGHLDDLPSSGAAPGADDNASGSVNVLENAKVLSCWAFKSTIKYIACTGEEQGLVGSDAYAADAQARGEDIRGVLNMDMIAWQGDGVPSPENLDLDYNDPSQDLGLLFAQNATDYATGLVVDAFSCPSLTASDHASFWERGYKAVCGITDNEGYCGHGGNYPYYHTSNDTIANCGNTGLFHGTIKTSIATLATLAEPFKIAFGRAATACDSSVGLVLGDRGLDTNPSSVETVAIQVWSTSEPDPELVTLTEDGPDSMIFRGTVTTTAAAPVHGDGLVSVAPGDTLTARYVDALDCDGSANVPYSAAIPVDCVAPLISSVHSEHVTGNSAEILWHTDELADARVVYDTVVPPAAGSSSNSVISVDHNVRLTGLVPCTPYYYYVNSTDGAGNTSSDTNGGAFYTFSTGENTTPTYTYPGPAVPIPDNNPAGATATINVADVDKIIDLNVVVNITHTFDGDITLTLIAPNGTSIPLANQRGSSGDNFVNTVFDDQATTPIANGTAPFTGSYQPESPLSVVNGLAAAGAWQLKVVDSASGDVGTIDNWSLQFTYEPRVCGPSATFQSYAATDSCPVGGTGSGNGVIERGEDVVMPVTIRNNGAVNLTGISAVLTTSNPDVAITRATATYADVASGLTVTSNAPHYAFTVGPGVPCGTDIAFSLKIFTNQGVFDSAFTVKVGTAASATTDYPSTDVPKPIPDNNSAGVTSSVTVAGTNPVTAVRVKVNITHTWDGDLALSLVAPNGTSVPLATNRGSSGDNFVNTVFDDAATTPISSGSAPFTGSYKPESPLAALNGIPANGTWMLKVVDSGASDTGTITGWTLTLVTAAGWACTDCILASPTGEPVQQSWVGKTGQQWETIAGATFYKLYRGVGGDLPKLVTADPDSCLRLTTVTTSTGAVLGEDPSAGSVYWYLVRAGNGGGEGPAGNATSGPRIQNSTGVCP